MEIKGKVHLMFEQSGTFKNEFKKLGYDAYDYDIQNNFNQTDFIIDLFNEIENCFDDKESIFDSISKDDLIIAFFPCIYFETIQQLCFSLEKYDQRNKSINERVLYAIDRLDKRTYFHKVLYKLLSIAMTKGLRLIIENPTTEPNYLISGQNFPQPTFVDKNRLLRGDYFKKPTAYWFFNCEPTNGKSYQLDKKPKRIDRTKSSPTAGICSEERSMISPDYARNFICDFILGKEQKNSELTLF